MLKVYETEAVAEAVPQLQDATHSQQRILFCGVLPDAQGKGANMTPQDLIAAAERQQHFTWPPGCCQCDAEVGYAPCEACFEESQIQLLARHVLATVRADDGEPVTVEWVDAETGLGNRSQSPYQRNYEIVPTIRLIAEACPGGFNPCELWIGAGDSFTRRSVTRGQVRSLLRALGRDVSNHA